MEGTTVLLSNTPSEQDVGLPSADSHVQDGLLPVVRRQSGSANAALESRSERVQRMAITAGVLVIVILGLAAMSYSFNEAQRKLEYVDDSEHLDPKDLERAWRRAGNYSTIAVPTTDDLDIISWLPSGGGEAPSGGKNNDDTDRSV